MTSDGKRGGILLPLGLLAALVVLALALWFGGPFIVIGGLAPFEMMATRALFILSFSVPMLILIFVVWRQGRPRGAGPQEALGRMARPRPYRRYAVIALTALVLGTVAVILWDGGASGFDAGHLLIAFAGLILAWAATLYYERSNTGRAAVIYAVLIAVGGIFAGNILVSYRSNLALIERTRSDIEDYRALVAQVRITPVADADFHLVAPALNKLRNMPGTGVFGQSRPTLATTWGLNQSGTLGSQTARAYRLALNQMLLPRLLYRLEGQIQTNLNNPDLLYEALKVYLMLGLQGPMDKAAVAQWMQKDWNIVLGAGDGLAADLADHLDVLISQPMQGIALNGPLVAQAQALLAEIPHAERVYRAILVRPELQELPDFRLSQIVSKDSLEILARPSGKPLSEGVEGAFTRRGFHAVFLPEMFGAVAEVRDEAWILGPNQELAQTQGSDVDLATDVLDLYYADYSARYEALLSDIDIAPIDDLQRAREVLRVLSGPASPIETILTAVSEETKLADQEFAASSEMPNTVPTSVLRRLQSVGRVIALSKALQEVSYEQGVPGQTVQDRFRWLHDLTDRDDDRPTVFDEINQRFRKVLADIEVTINSGGASVSTQALTGLSRIGVDIPDPMRRWVLQVSGSFSGVAAASARREINAAWQATVLPVCEAATFGRYPFDKRSGVDVSLQDFGKVFGPGGVMDVFFNTRLAGYVDTAATPWRWTGDGADLGISDAVLAQFENAFAIRDSFFTGGGALPRVPFLVRPEALDPKAERVTIEVGGRKIDYGHDPVGARTLEWPGNALAPVRVSFLPEREGIENTLERTGAWAWPRLLDASEFRATNDPDRKRIIFNVGGRIAIFEMILSGAQNPFSLPALAEFNCPRSL